MDRDRPTELTLRQRLGRAARNGAHPLGRWVLWTGLIALFLWKAPVVPYSPTCTKKNLPAGAPAPPGTSQEWMGDDLVIEGPMTKEFVDSFTKHLDWWNVSYLRIGDNVFLSFWTEFTGGYDGIVNSNDRALDEQHTQLDLPGAPPELRARAGRMKRGEHVFDDCLLARAVAIENWGRGE